MRNYFYHKTMNSLHTKKIEEDFDMKEDVVNYIVDNHKDFLVVDSIYDVYRYMKLNHVSIDYNNTEYDKILKFIKEYNITIVTVRVKKYFDYRYVNLYHLMEKKFIKSYLDDCENTNFKNYITNNTTLKVKFDA